MTRIAAARSSPPRSGRARLGLVALLLAWLGATHTPRAQQTAQDPTPTFRAAVEAVEIDVYVTDEDGNPVSGLTVDDFELFEAGVPQPITTFSAVDIPIRSAETIERAIGEPDVQSNNGPIGRTYVFALDVFGENTLKARRLLREFIETHFGPHDVAAIALLGRALATNGQDFTSNRRLLLEAVDKFAGSYDRGGICGEPKFSLVGDGIIPLPSRYHGRIAQWESLREIAEVLARMPGRHKAMLLFSDCITLDMLDVVDYQGGVLGLAFEDAHAMMTAATRSNLAIYPIDPSGVGRATIEDVARFHALADATGGAALVNSNNFPRIFERIIRDTSTYYMLGFNSAHEQDDGRYVRIEVRVKRPGLVARTRAGYVAPTPQERRARERARARETPPPTAASAALANPLATDGLPMRVFATPFRRDEDEALVALALELDASKLELELTDGAYVGEVEVSYLATDAKRRIYPERRHTASIRIQFDAGEPPLLEDVRVRVLTELELKKGRYQLRVGSSTNVQSGSVVYDLEVPDFSDAPLTMSGLALISPSEQFVVTLLADGRDPAAASTTKCYRGRCTAPLGGALPPARSTPTPAPYMEGRLPGPPTTAREFATDDQVVLAVEVYDNRRVRRNAPHTIALTASLLALDGQLIALASEQRSATAPRSRAGGHAFALPLPLSQIPAGMYALRVHATSSAGEEFTIAREIPIRIR